MSFDIEGDILKKYKDHGTVMAPKAKDERIMMA